MTLISNTEITDPNNFYYFNDWCNNQVFLSNCSGNRQILKTYTYGLRPYYANSEGGIFYNPTGNTSNTSLTYFNGYGYELGNQSNIQINAVDNSSYIHIHSINGNVIFNVSGNGLYIDNNVKIGGGVSGEFYGNSYGDVSSNVISTNVANFVTGNITSNTFMIGTSSLSSNGHSYLPNKIKMNWATVVVNSTSGNVIFDSAYSNVVISVSVTPISSILVGANTCYIDSVNTTGVSIRSATTNTTSNVYVLVMGN